MGTQMSKIVQKTCLVFLTWMGATSFLFADAQATEESNDGFLNEFSLQPDHEQAHEGYGYGERQEQTNQEECQNECVENDNESYAHWKRWHHYSHGAPWDYYDFTLSERARGTRYGLTGVWLPEDPILFRPFIADPHQVCYSVGWRFNDQALAKNVIDVSYGDTLPLYRWFYVWPWCGQMQIEIEGALWAVFAPLQESAPLINADYYVAIPITYAIDKWSFRLRAFHISSHIGDEFLLEHPCFDRRNPSAEFLDFSVSHDFTDEIRFYGLVGGILHQDESFKTRRIYAEAGAELRLEGLGFIDHRQQLYGVPFYAMHCRYKADFKKHVDMTYALGYEWGKICGRCKKVRLFAEYHDGYSVDGQFERYANNYFSIRIVYGY